MLNNLEKKPPSIMNIIFMRLLFLAGLVIVVAAVIIGSLWFIGSISSKEPEPVQIEVVSMERVFIDINANLFPDDVEYIRQSYETYGMGVVNTWIHLYNDRWDAKVEIFCPPFYTATVTYTLVNGVWEFSTCEYVQAPYT